MDHGPNFVKVTLHVRIFRYNPSKFNFVLYLWYNSHSVFNRHVGVLKFCVPPLLLCSVCSTVPLAVCHAQVAGTILLCLSMSSCLTFLMLEEANNVLDAALCQVHQVSGGTQLYQIAI